jgi:hypothetical protein
MAVALACLRGRMGDNAGQLRRRRDGRGHAELLIVGGAAAAGRARYSHHERGTRPGRVESPRP